MSVVEGMRVCMYRPCREIISSKRYVCERHYRWLPASLRDAADRAWSGLSRRPARGRRRTAREATTLGIWLQVQEQVAEALRSADRLQGALPLDGGAAS